jgi:hypothetical protein
MVLKFAKKPCCKIPAKINQSIRRKLTAEPLENTEDKENKLWAPVLCRNRKPKIKILGQTE